MKKTIIGIIHGLVLCVAGAILHDYYEVEMLGEILVILGIIVVSIFTIILVYKLLKTHRGKFTSFINQKTTARKKLHAENELLRYRELYDKEILTKEEFDQKISELKNRIL